MLLRVCGAEVPGKPLVLCVRGGQSVVRKYEQAIMTHKTFMTLTPLFFHSMSIIFYVAASCHLIGMRDQEHVCVSKTCL